MKINFPFVAGAGYIAFWVGFAMMDIGEDIRGIPECGVYEWWLPLLILVVIAIPFICGYIAGYIAGVEEQEERKG